MIDASREEVVGYEELKSKGLVAYVTGKAVHLRQRDGVQTIDFSQSSGERPMRVDAAVYREMEKTFNWIFYPVMLALAFVLFAASTAAFAALYGGLAMLASPGLSFGRGFAVGARAQAAPALLRCADLLLPFAIPYSGLIALLLGAVYAWLGARAHGAPKGEAPA